MGLPGLPKIDIDIKGTIEEFLTLLRDMNAKLDVLIELQQGVVDPEDQAEFCSSCDQMGRLRCPTHGQTMVPTLGSTR